MSLNPSQTWRPWALAVLVVGLLSSAPATGVQRVERVTREAWLMGTRVRITVEGASRRVVEGASEGALREIERLERVLSTWEAGTELARVNASTPAIEVRVSTELADLLKEAEGWAVRTGRAFDPTVGALVDAWDIRGRGQHPSDRELATALAATGRGALSIGAAHVVRASRNAWIDPGGFGKGAALRAAAAAARGQGADRFLVDLGGQILAVAGSDAPWAVDIAHPVDRSRPVERLHLHGVSAATSGGSERPGHVIDPRSGRPVPQWGSVSVVSSDPVEADVLSTALFVMGPEEGLAWARAAGVAALFLEPTDDGLRSARTEAMDRWLRPTTSSTNPNR